jgi:hypothetical protein
VLAEQQETLEHYRTLVASYPKKLEEAVEKAKAEAMNEVDEEAKVQAELFEKDREANKHVSELHIASLKEIIDQQAHQIGHLSTQLQAALQQVQDLAAKAVTGKAETRV